MLNLVTLAIFVFVVSLAWLLARRLLKSRQAMVAGPLLGSVSAQSAPGPSAVANQALIESLAAQLPPMLFAGEELDKDLRRAGHYGPYARQKLFALRNGLVILAVLVTGVLAVGIGPEHHKAVMWTLAVGFAATVMAFALPRVLLAINAKRRLMRISASLPDALDTISMCLHGGISLQECLGYVGREMTSVHPDLAFELLVVGQQAKINSFEFAIQQFATRIDAPEVVALATLATQNQRLGTGIVDSIRDFADDLRLKRRQMAEAKASRAELFLLFPLIFCLMPSVLILLSGPFALSLYNFITGPSSLLRINP